MFFFHQKYFTSWFVVWIQAVWFQKPAVLRWYELVYQVYLILCSLCCEREGWMSPRRKVIQTIWWSLGSMFYVGKTQILNQATSLCSRGHLPIHHPLSILGRTSVPVLVYSLFSLMERSRAGDMAQLLKGLHWKRRIWDIRRLVWHACGLCTGEVGIGGSRGLQASQSTQISELHFSERLSQRNKVESDWGRQLMLTSGVHKCTYMSCAYVYT